MDWIKWIELAGYIFLGLPLCMLLGILVHESGHLLCGIANGFKFNMLVVGPIGIKKENNKTKLYIEHNKGYWGGVSLTLPTTNDNLKNLNVFKKILISGPIFSLLIGLLILAIALFLRIYILIIPGLIIFSYFLSTILPLETQMFYTDGMRYRILKNKDKRAFEECAILKVTFNVIAHESYLYVDFDDIDMLMKSDIAKNKYLGHCYYYLYLKAQGNVSSAKNIYAKVLELEKLVPKKFAEIMMPKDEI